MKLRDQNWKSLIRPKKLEFTADAQQDENYCKFTAGPFERGYGATLGNALRRVLLSSLQGAAITAFRIEGVLHEFSSIPGVYEDVTNIVLNLKELRFRLHSDGPKFVSLDVDRAGKVTAGDIVADAGVEILNPDHHIATIQKGGHLKMEMVVQLNKGFVLAERNKSENEDLPVDFIPVDSLHSPILKVNYSVENARVGRMTDYDKLIMEIATDGSVAPRDALAYAAKIVKDHMDHFINFEEEPAGEGPSRSGDDVRVLHEKLNKSVSELELSVRSINCLQNANIGYIGELVRRTEADMLKTKNFGRKSLTELKEILNEMGLQFDMDVQGWEPPQPGEADEASLEDAE